MPDATERCTAVPCRPPDRDIIAALLRSIGDGVLVAAIDGSLLLMNLPAERLLGWTEAELLGKPMHTVLCSRHGGSVVDGADEHTLLRALRAGDHMTVESDEWIRREGTPLSVSYTATPLRSGEQITGAVITFRDRTAHVASEEQLQVREAESRTGQAPTYELLEQLVAERTRELSTLLDVSHNVASTLELGPLLGLILNQLKTVADYTGAAILSREDEHIRVLQYRGPLPREQVLTRRYAVEHAVGYQAVSRANGPVIVDDMWGESPLAVAFRESPNVPTHGSARSLLFLPLVVKDRLIGVIRIDHTTPNYYMAGHAALALAIANQAAVAIENARLYAQAQEMAAVEERARLARDLHDSVTQVLFSASLMAETLPRLWDRDPDQGRQRLEDVRLLTRGALAEMRMLLLELRPAALTDARLGDLLRPLTEALAGRKRLHVSLDVEGERSLPSEVQVALYRIAQEALNNVARHAAATTVDVRLQCRPEGVDLQISDDGRGFEATRVAAGHFGLGIMRERAASVGATLTVQSRPGAGTQVRVVWHDLVD